MSGVQAKWAKYSTLVRVSVGLEDIEDLIHDFDQALNAVFTPQ
jgi:cystathionine beta-lyase/cystathionine gamma-synthase